MDLEMIENDLILFINFTPWTQTFSPLIFFYCFLIFFSANSFAISASPPMFFSFATVHCALSWIILSSLFCWLLCNKFIYKRRSHINQNNKVKIIISLFFPPTFITILTTRQKVMSSNCYVWEICYLKKKHFLMSYTS